MTDLVHSGLTASIPSEGVVGGGAQMARDFAIIAHGDQMYGETPYIHHLDAVAAVVKLWGFQGDILRAAYLHDVIEDTSVSGEQLAATFGRRVADIVWAVTGEGGTRDERMDSIYAKVSRHGAAAVVKLADRIANIEVAELGSDHAARYEREDAAFTAAIKSKVPATCWLRYVTALRAKAGPV